MKKILSMILATIIVLGLITVGVEAESESAHVAITADGAPRNIRVDGVVSYEEWGKPDGRWTYSANFKPSLSLSNWDSRIYDTTSHNDDEIKMYARAGENGIYLAFQFVNANGRNEQATVSDLKFCAGLDFSIGTYDTVGNVKHDGNGKELRYTYRIYETYDDATQTYTTNQAGAKNNNPPPLNQVKVGYDTATNTYTYEVLVPYDECIIQGEDIVLSFAIRDKYTAGKTEANSYNVSKAARMHVLAYSSAAYEAPFRDYNPIRLTFPECYVNDKVAPMPASALTINGEVSEEEWGTPVIVTSPEHVEKVWGSTGYTKGTNANQDNNQRAKVYMTNDDEYLYIAATLDRASASENRSAQDKFSPVLGVTVSQYVDGSVYMAGVNECFRLFRISRKYNGDIATWTRIYDTTTTDYRGDHQAVDFGDYAVEYNDATTTYTFEMKIKWDTIPGMRDDQWKTSPIALTLHIGDGNLGDTKDHSNSYYQIGGTADLKSTATRTPHAEGGFIVMNINNQLDKAAAKIGNDNYYLTIDDAVKAAKSGDTVTLLANAKMEQWTDTVGITLNLDGHTLTANTVSAINPSSKIISKDGEGGIKIAKNDEDATNLNLKLDPGNPQLPLYDAKFGGYRFFNCTLEHNARWKVPNTKYQFGYVLKMSGDAFDLLEDFDNDKKLDADIELVYTISLTVDGDSALNNEKYIFSTDLMTKATSNISPTLGVTGFDQVKDQVIVLTSSNPMIESSTGVNIVPEDKTLTLTYPNA